MTRIPFTTCRVVYAALPLLLFAAAGACREKSPTRPEDLLLTWADSAFGKDAVEWVVDDTAGAWTMEPELDEIHVYFESDAGHLVALDRTSGALKWKGDIIAAQNAAIAGEFVAAIWGGLEVFHRSTGQQRYRFVYPNTSLNSNVESSGGRFHMLTHHGRAVAIDAADGSIEWDTNLAGGSGTGGFGVAVAGEMIIATLKHFQTSPEGADTGIVAALSASIGAVRWRVTINPDSFQHAGIVRPAVLSGSNVIVKTQGHDVFAFDIATGERRWKFDADYGSPTMGSDGLSACNGRVILATGDLGLVALDAATGAIQWKVPDLEQGSLRSIRCSHGTVLVLGSMLVLDAATGRRLATYPIVDPGAFDAPFWITGATRDESSLYIATTRGYAKVAAP